MNPDAVQHSLWLDFFQRLNRNQNLLLFLLPLFHLPKPEVLGDLPVEFIEVRPVDPTPNSNEALREAYRFLPLIFRGRVRAEDLAPSGNLVSGVRELGDSFSRAQQGSLKVGGRHGVQLPRSQLL